MNPLTRDGAGAAPQVAESESGSAPSAMRSGAATPAANPLCVEIPVRLRGSKAPSPGSDLAETFTEDTHTMILLSRGAVVRLASPVSTGQDLILTNLKTNLHVHCKVVSVRPSDRERGYVELEFTHRKEGFWESTPIVRRSLAAAAAPSRPAAAQKSAPTVNAVQAAAPAPPSPAMDETIRSAPALARVTPASMDHIPMRRVAPSAPPPVATAVAPIASDRTAAAVLDAPDELPPPAVAPAPVPHLDLESANRRIAGDFRTGRRWILTGTCLVAVALVVIGGLFWERSQAQAGTNAPANPTATVTQAAEAASQSFAPTAPQVVEVTDAAESPAAQPSESLPDAPATGTPSQGSPASTAPTKSGIQNVFSRAVSKLHLSIGNSSMIRPAASPARATSTPDAPPSVAPTDASAAVPGGQTNGFSNALSARASPEPPAPPPAPAIPVGGQATLPRAISIARPQYPPAAKTSHIEGDVTIQAEIDAFGKVVAMKVLSGPGVLQAAALDALRQWKYEPATLDGRAVAGELIVTLKFRLQ